MPPVFRLGSDNLYDALATSLSASSEAAALPVGASQSPDRNERRLHELGAKLDRVAEAMRRSGSHLRSSTESVEAADVAADLAGDLDAERALAADVVRLALRDACTDPDVWSWIVETADDAATVGVFGWWCYLAGLDAGALAEYLRRTDPAELDAALQRGGPRRRR